MKAERLLCRVSTRMKYPNEHARMQHPSHPTINGSPVLRGTFYKRATFMVPSWRRVGATIINLLLYTMFHMMSHMMSPIRARIRIALNETGEMLSLAIFIQLCLSLPVFVQLCLSLPIFGQLCLSLCPSLPNFAHIPAHLSETLPMSLSQTAAARDVMIQALHEKVDFSIRKIQITIHVYGNMLGRATRKVMNGTLS